MIELVRIPDPALMLRGARSTKLSVNILFESLSATFTVELFGKNEGSLRLSRPKLSYDNEVAFLDDHLYLVMADRLPPKPEVQKDAVIICIGESIRTSYYKDRCCLLCIKERVHIFEVANHISTLFDRYDTWHEKLLEILYSTASVEDMLACSYTIFENPLFAIGSDFQILAHAGYNESKSRATFESTSGKNLSLPSLAQYLELRDPLLHVKEPLLINILDTSTLNVNLFNGEDYIGCLTIDYRLKRHCESDNVLAEYLAGMLVKALQRLSVAVSSERSMIVHALQDAVEGMPPTTEQRMALEKAGLGRSFVCAKMKFSNRIATLPLGYICNEIEEVFLGSIAFAHDAFAIAFIEISGFGATKEEQTNKLHAALLGFVESMDMHVGISESFNDVSNAYLFYHQAAAALETGELLSSDSRYFAFDDLVLKKMILCVIKELPLEVFYSHGMRQLIIHDTESAVSYLDTLQTYLNHNMNVTKAANELYIHRSTLLERIVRIERELAVDLKNPDERLKIQLMLKAASVQNQLLGDATLDYQPDRQ